MRLFVQMGIVIATLLWGTPLQAKKVKVKLDRGEKVFHQMPAYTIKDFHFAWDIGYLEFFVFDAESSDGKKFKIDPKTTTLRSMMRVGKIKETNKTEKDHKWLMHAILKQDYFWKTMLLPPGAVYGFSTLHFTKGDNHLKAIETKEEILQMLGKIDTEAEVRLWLSVLDLPTPYSYKKTKNGYRIRFAGENPFTCNYEEYFISINSQNGVQSKIKWLKKNPIKNCVIIQP